MTPSSWNRGTYLRRLAIGYVGLLLISHLVVWWRPAPEIPAEMASVVVPDFRADGTSTGRSVEMAFLEIPGADERAPVVVVLHGSPVASSFLQPFLRELGSRSPFHLLAPDLPGMGVSTRQVTDYSIAAHAHAVDAWLAALGVSEAHVIGYSMGGGVALELAENHPSRVKSLILLSAIGVQEYEMFGLYEINHSVHALQWVVLNALRWGVPHFGWFDRQPLNVSYARNFLDTDQRPLRAYLGRYQGPMLIQHGTRDRLVPLQAAREHARLVPQSLLRLYEGGHALVFSEPEQLVGDAIAFVDTVEEGRALTRERADPLRRERAAKPFERDRSWQYTGLAAVVVVLLLMAATMLSEDLTCIGGGFLAANGLISLPLAIIACFLGILIGDLLLYLAGRKLGRPALRRRPLRWFVSETAERRAEAWFRRRGAIIIVASRFLPGTRAATYFTAGVVRAPFWKFLLYFGFAAALWTPLLVTFASRVGERMFSWYESYEAWALPGLMGGVLVLYLFVEYGIPLSSQRGRRLLLGKWRRLTRWEYWPLWIVNAPVLLYVLWLGFIRYRRPTAFTLCNPGIPHSGFIGESKAAILAQFPADADYVLPWDCCPAGEAPAKRWTRLERLQKRLAAPWPIVIKPDEGQRGLGVHIVRTADQARSVLARTANSWILQGYAPGDEYGIFYYRMPGAIRGSIPSITIKVMTSVTGDGKKTIEDLILADDRAVDQAPRFLEQMADRLEEIPPLGAVIPLVELGTHARGAIFLDGRSLLTPELEDRIESIARDFKGFYYGRFDIRVPSTGDLRAGHRLKLLEVNGLTSEQTHIYAPGASLLSAWRTLMGSWHRAILIGLEVEKHQNLQPWPVWKFLRWWWQSYWRQRKIGSLASSTSIEPRIHR